MRVGFDAKRLFHNSTGLGVYSRMLVHQLDESATDLELILYDRQPTNGKYYSAFKDYSIRHGRGLLWRTLRISKNIVADQCAIYHGLSHELPLNLHRYPEIGKVVTIHDLIFEQYPDLYAPLDRRIYRWKWQHACRIADAIICISEATKKELIHYYEVDPNKISIVPPLHNPAFEQQVSSTDIDKIRLEYKLPDHYLLAVGSVIERKNLLSVIRAMGRLSPHERLPLVVIGQGRRYLAKCQAEATHLGLQSDIRWCQQVPNRVLPGMYAQATASIYVSRCEGFGIPVLESLYAGTPVITSNCSSLPEAAGPGALLVDPMDIDAIASAIKRLSSNEQEGKNLVRAATKHLKYHQNEHLAAKVLGVYEQVRGSKHL